MKRNLLSIVIVLLAASLLGLLFNSTGSNNACSAGSTAPISEKKGHSNMSTATAISTSNFDSEVLKSNEPVLVDFWASWCMPCRMLGPTIDQLAIDYKGKAKIVKVNVDENQELALKYGVRSIPTIILFKSGEPVDRMVGVQSKQTLAGKLDSITGN